MRVEKKPKAFAYRIYSHFTQQCTDQLHSQYILYELILQLWFNVLWAKSSHWPRAQKSKDTQFFCGEFHHKTNDSKNQAKSLRSCWDLF